MPPLISRWLYHLKTGDEGTSPDMKRLGGTLTSGGGSLIRGIVGSKGRQRLGKDISGSGRFHKPAGRADPATAFDRENDVFVIISRVASAGSATRLGAPAYSYSYLAERMSRALDMVGVEHRLVDLPEYFGHPASFVDRDGSSLDGRPIVHLCIRPFDQLRLIRGVYNIAYVAWEYPVIKSELRPGEMKLDVPTMMLGQFDEVWATSDYGRRVIADHGVRRTVTVPAPFFPEDETTVSHEQAVRSIGGKSCVPFRHNFAMLHSLNVSISRERLLPLASLLGSPDVSKIVLTILNPGDPRKNLANMLTAFSYFAERHPDWIFLVKASQHGLDCASIANLAMTPKLAGIGLYDFDNVYVMSDFLSDDELDALYSVADFYITAAFAEGQNLPLQEAMLRGVVPIATLNTAMTDYVSADCAVTIQSRSTSTQVPAMAHTAAGATVPSVDLASERDILDALERAAEIDDAEYNRLSRGARGSAFAHLAAGPIAERVAGRLRGRGRVLA